MNTNAARVYIKAFQVNRRLLNCPYFFLITPQLLHNPTPVFLQIMDFDISFEWNGKQYQAGVTKTRINGVPVWMVVFNNEKQQYTYPFTNDGSRWACQKLGYRLTNCIGFELDKQIKQSNL